MKLFYVAIIWMVSINVFCQPLSKSNQILDSLAFLSVMPSKAVMKKELRKIVDIGKAEKDLDVAFEALSYLAYSFHEEKDYINYFKVVEELRNTWIKMGDVNNANLKTLLNNQSLVNSIQGNHKQAINYLLKAIELSKDLDDDFEALGAYYSNIYNRYLSVLDYNSALKYSSKSIDTYMKIDTNQYTINKSMKFLNLAESYFFQGCIFRERKEYYSSIPNFQKSIEYLKFYIHGLDKKTELIIRNYQNIGGALLNLKQSDKVGLVLEFLDSIHTQTDYLKYRTEMLKGKCLSLTRPTSSVDRNFAACFELLQQDTTKKYGESELAKLYYTKANEYFKRINFDKTLENVELGLLSNMKSIFNKNTELNNLEQNVFIDLLNLKIKANLELYKISKLEKYLDSVWPSLNKHIALLDKMKSSYLTEGSKFYAAEKAYPVYNQAIYVLYEKYKLDQADSTLNQIYTVMEKNKSSILFESVEEKYRLLSSDLPEEMIDQESSLKSSISFYSKLKSEEEAKDTSDSQKIKELESAIFEAEEEYAILNQKIKSEYSDFYNYRENITKDKTLKDLQLSLAPGQLALEYYEGDSSLYILSVDRAKAHIEKLPLDQVETLAKNYRDLVSHSPVRTSGMEEFIETSSSLANVILKSIISKHNGIDQLVIIPDGQLNQIPFESLILDTKNGELDYALKTYEIAYYFSTEQFITKEKKTNEIAPEVLCIAPVFKGKITDSRACDVEDLGRLPHAQDELKHIEENFEGLFIASNKTKKSDLLENIEKFPVIHLATHACLNVEDPLLSEIHFNDGHLTNYDIRDLKVRPELVVLSACNTAQGEVKKGEGMISLSRGFFEAGVKSLQASLWSIDDYSSAEIVKSMYSYLSDGRTKSAALRMAKLDHLSKADKLRKHPYYWAGIIQIGDQSPLFTKSNWKPLIIGVSLGVLLLGGLAYRKKMAA